MQWLDIVWILGCFCHSGRSTVCSERPTQLLKTSHRHRVQLCSTITQHRTTTKYSLNNLIYGGVWMEAVKMIKRKEDEAVRHTSLCGLLVHRRRKSVEINTLTPWLWSYLVTIRLLPVNLLLSARRWHCNTSKLWGMCQVCRETNSLYFSLNQQCFWCNECC